MKILKYLKSLFGDKISDSDSEEVSNNSAKEFKGETLEAKVTELSSLENKFNEIESKKNIDESLKKLRRLKYKESNFSLANRLECEVLNYLLSEECNCFNVYWNVYVPCGANRYMQIDQLVVTTNTVYAIECKDFKSCTSIEVFAEHWECYYKDGKHYKIANGVFQNTKHISVLKKYLKDFNLDFKSIVILVVDDDFDGYIPDDEVILVRNKEFDLIFKLLDRKLKVECDENVDHSFIELNEKVYKCMNPSSEIIESHRKYIEEKYK